MADLLDRLGKSIVQRDDAMKEKTKLKAQLHQSRTEIVALQEERKRVGQQNNSFKFKLTEATKANKILLGEGPYQKEKRRYRGKNSSVAGSKEDNTPVEEEEDDGYVSDLSDEEFEEELTNFERRYQVRDEGAKGLDVWVESLHKERNILEKTKTEQQELIMSLERNIKSYHLLSEQKDNKMRDLEARYLRVQEDHARIQNQVASKQVDLEYRIEAERRNFESRIKKLQSEFEHAASTAQGYQSLNEKLQQELLKVIIFISLLTLLTKS